MGARSRIGWTAVALGALFAGMVAWALLAVERPESAARAAQEREARVLAFPPAEVVSVAVEPRSGAALRLERAEGGWRLRPSGEPAGPLLVEGFLDRLAAMRVRTTLPPGPGGLPALGLDPPAARVTLALRGGKTLSLDLGDENPFDRTRYCRAGGDVRVVEGVPKAAVDPDPEAFRAAPDAR